nr:hypothetical protein [Methylobacterium nodulans]
MLLPDTHLVDAGYVDADQLLANARDHDVTLLGPTPQDTQWQARTPGAFRVQDFRIDWDREVATGPAGHASTSWSADHNQGRTVMRIRFSSADCKPCALHALTAPVAHATAGRGARCPGCGAGAGG